MPCRSSSFDSRCRARIRSPRTSSRARTKSRAASCSTVGTTTSTISSSFNNRASSSASRASVFTRSPQGRCSFDGAATGHRNPAPRRYRARPNPVGPASYVSATGCGSVRSQPSMSTGSGVSFRCQTSPVTASRPCPVTDQACTSNPTNVGSLLTEASRNCGSTDRRSLTATHDHLRARPQPCLLIPTCSIPAGDLVCSHDLLGVGMGRSSHTCRRISGWLLDGLRPLRHRPAGVAQERSVLPEVGMPGPPVHRLPGSS